MKSETRLALEEIRSNLKFNLAAVKNLFLNYTYDDDRIDDLDFMRMEGSIENAVEVFDVVLKSRRKKN